MPSRRSKRGSEYGGCAKGPLCCSEGAKQQHPAVKVNLSYGSHPLFITLISPSARLQHDQKRPRYTAPHRRTPQKVSAARSDPWRHPVVLGPSGLVPRLDAQFPPRQPATRAHVERVVPLRSQKP